MSNNMMRRRPKVLRALALTSTMLCSLIAAPAGAQSISVAPTRETRDSNSVDLFRGNYVIDETVASIGGSQGMKYRRINRGDGGFTDNYTAVLQSVSTTFLASVNGSTDRFTKTGSSTWVPTEANGSSLTYNSTTQIYTYTSRDGTVVTFDKKKVDENEPGLEGIATSIVQPSGERIDFAFDRVSYCLEYGGGGDQCTGGFGHARRLSSARNAYGYIFKTIYDVDTIDTPDQLTAWLTPSDQRLVNRTVDNCDPSGACNLVQSWPGPNNPNQVINSYVWTGSKITGIKRPGSSSNDLTLAYDGSGRISSISNHAGSTSYGYSDSGSTRTVTVTNALSEVTVYVFDIPSERLTSVTDPLSNTTSYAYDSSGRLTRVTKPEGNYTNYAYDARGNVTETRQVAKSGSGNADIVTTAAFAASCTNVVTCNSPTSTTDARGNVTDYTWDSTHGGVLTVTAPAPTIGAVRPKKTFTYASKQAQVKSATGTIVADSQTVILPISVSECVSTSSCIGTTGEVKSTVVYGSTGVANNLLPTSFSSGDGSGALNATTALAYDNIGNVISVDGPLSGSDDTTTAVYDSLRHNVGTIAPDPDGAGSRPRLAQRQTFGTNGDLTKTEIGTVTGTGSTDLASMTVGQTVDLTYDADGHKVKEALSGGGTTFTVSQLSYDAEGRLSCTAQRMNSSVFSSLPSSACSLGTTGSFGPDRITKSIRDADGRVTQVKQAFGTTDEANERTLGFSANGQLAYLTDAQTNRTTYEYDGHDRLVKTRYPVTTVGSDSSSTTDYEQLTLDAAGNATSRRLRDAQSIGYTYDALGRMTAKDLPGGEPDATYAFDLLNRMTSATQNSITNSFTWDALGRLTAETAPQGTVSSQYDLAGRRTRVTLPGSTTLYADYDFDVTGQVTAIRENGATSGVGVLATYSYDSIGRRSSMTFGNGVSQPYTYDNASRLASLGNDLSGTTNDLAQAFTYSPASQIATAVRTGDSYAWTGHYNQNAGSTPNGLNQIGNVGSKNLAHDSRGNITAVGTDSYAYSSENLLASGPNSTTLSYDPMMRLYQVASGNITTRMGYDGPDRVAEYDGSNAVLRRYIHGAGTDEPIVWYEGSGTLDRRFLSVDERGSIISVTGGSGALLGINGYDEFGNPAAANVGKFGYTGQTWLPELGIWHYKMRNYRADVGRFLQTDPVGSPNPYAYVGNEPIGRSDPSGAVWSTGHMPSSDGGGELTYVAYYPGSPSSSEGEHSGSSANSESPTLLSFNNNYLSADNPASDSLNDAIVVTGTRSHEGYLTIPSYEFAGISPGGGTFGGGGASGSWGCGCLVKGTLVATPRGSVPIESLGVGSLVLAMNEKTGEIASKPVTKLIRPVPKPIYKLTLKNAVGEAQIFQATNDHPWKVRNKGWVKTVDLAPSDHIDTISDEDVVVVSVEQTGRVERAYNLEIADFHTFMIGRDGVVVHNACPPSQSPVWKKLKPWRGSIKTDGTRYYTYDRLHGEIEVFDKRGNHLGPIDPYTGEAIPGKGAVPGRTLDGGR